MAVSPSGERLAYMDDEGVAVYDFETGRTERVALVPELQTTYLGEGWATEMYHPLARLEWSPDGRYILWHILCGLGDEMSLRVIDLSNPGESGVTGLGMDVFEYEWAPEGVELEGGGQSG